MDAWVNAGVGLMALCGVLLLAAIAVGVVLAALALRDLADTCERLKHWQRPPGGPPVREPGRKIRGA